jgi:hypothetical protein
VEFDGDVARPIMRLLGFQGGRLVMEKPWQGRWMGVCKEISSGSMVGRFAGSTTYVKGF